jgi:hypothetical protein
MERKDSMSVNKMVSLASEEVGGKKEARVRLEATCGVEIFSAANSAAQLV